MSNTIHVRHAHPDDAPTILGFIRELAEYEREPDAVKLTQERLRTQLESKRPPFECLLAETKAEGSERAVGFALFYPTYSTWEGRQGVWLEDFYVTPAARGVGAGRALFDALVELGKARGYARLELTALNWNALANDFYGRRNLKAMREWTTWRLELYEEGAA